MTVIASSPQPAERRYFRRPDDGMQLRALDGLTLIFHRASGLTHIVDSPVPEIIGALSAAPQTAEDIVRTLSASYDLMAGQDAAAELTHHLESLCALGLIRAE